ncbi:helix-turn-helix transcriptional regulator [Methyloceanibacter caenitepidi]|uniref:Transcriptional regulatory protein n=1 Tax=Methyloceanibacter caenitepidi TaxID=1384459 RepID=A0A0A8K6T7_9HYPH|nr:helix-turn-helix transcriptional regulator [Methyloceanibacter caenitepidi]BAQ18635.1 transcriptional regulatory protein [Methyloceanibacter caenitepidi]
MRRSLVDAVADVQDAAWCGNGVSDVIRTVAEEIGAVGGVALQFHSETQDLLRIFAHGLPQIEQEYAEEYVHDPNVTDAHVKYSLGRAEAHTVCDYDLMSESEINRNPSYDWLQRAVGVKYFIGSRLDGGGPEVTLLGMHYEARQGHASDQQVERCRMLRPHIANAVRIGRLKEQAKNAATFAEILSANLPFGLLCINPDGTCIQTNAIADRILREGDGVYLGSDRRLHLSCPQAEPVLQRAIGKALKACAGQSVFAGEALVAARPSAKPSYLISAEPGLSPARGYDVSAPVVLVKIQDPSLRLALSDEQLNGLFGLTGRESELLRRLIGGETLKAAAARMGISYNTARVHLQRIYEKTGVASQSELVGRFSVPLF